MTTEGRVGWKMIPCSFSGAGLGTASAAGSLVVTLGRACELVEAALASVVGTTLAESNNAGANAGEGAAGVVGVAATGTSARVEIAAGFAVESVGGGTAGAGGCGAGPGVGAVWAAGGGLEATICGWRRC